MTRDPVSLAEIEHDMQQTKREREIPDGQIPCQQCGELIDEGDAYDMGCETWCEACIVGRSERHRRAVRLLRRVAPLLAAHYPATAREINEFVEGW